MQRLAQVVVQRAAMKRDFSEVRDPQAGDFSSISPNRRAFWIAGTGLRRESLRRSTACSGNQARLLAPDHQHADKMIGAEQRHDQKRSEARSEYDASCSGDGGVSRRSGTCTVSTFRADARLIAAASSIPTSEIAAITASLMPKVARSLSFCDVSSCT